MDVIVLSSNSKTGSWSHVEKTFQSIGEINLVRDCSFGTALHYIGKILGLESEYTCRKEFGLSKKDQSILAKKARC